MCLTFSPYHYTFNPDGKGASALIQNSLFSAPLFSDGTLWTSRFVCGPDHEAVNSQEHLIRDKFICLDVATALNREAGATMK